MREVSWTGHATFIWAGDVEEIAVNLTGIWVIEGEAQEEVVQTAWICSVDVEAHNVGGVRCVG
jgi:hypothetical protein